MVYAVKERNVIGKKSHGDFTVYEVGCQGENIQWAHVAIYESLEDATARVNSLNHGKALFGPFEN